jgi:hypothetical protein
MKQATSTTKVLTYPYALFCMLFVHLLLGLLFDLEDGGEMFLRNIGWLSADYTELHPRRWTSS